MAHCRFSLSCYTVVDGEPAAQEHFPENEILACNGPPRKRKRNPDEGKVKKKRNLRR